MSTALMFLASIVGIILNGVIFWTVFTYRREGATYRPGCNFIAYLVMCLSVLTIARIATDLTVGVYTYSWVGAFWQIFICWGLVYSKGNVSFFIKGWGSDHTLDQICRRRDGKH